MAVLVRVEGGPHVGLTAVETPLQPTIALGVDAAMAPDHGPDPYAYAIYELRREAGEDFYFFQAYRRKDNRPLAKEAINERRLDDAINHFYANPNYDIYTMKPTGRHEQVYVEVGHRRAHVDVGLAELIRNLFRLGFDTYGSCQERPGGDAFEGQAYVAFPREEHAQRFYDMLQAAGIQATIRPRKMVVVTKQSPDAPGDPMQVQSGSVMFLPSDIERIVKLLQASV